MFKSKSKSKDVKLDPNTTDTIIGTGSIFEGKIKSDAGIRVEGQITGDIDCEGDVTVGENGQVHSNIIARNIIIAGTVTGNVQARSKLSITSKGKLYGNIKSTTLSIEEGSIFEGNSQMENITQSEAVKLEVAAAIAEPVAPVKGNAKQVEEEVTYKTW
ncbi:polymer-forming cytoskeletal protein [Paenibacillus anaericanus]|uniref:Polymer-forming cytoskeletal protein n=1 Tax=Paenibacillus anaericanus TaxID=170367 RepID=A0A3S1BPT7_9BACL|nr:polymer-forming cytoskeletal protein [Paenibacillus anaericanus]RUT46710.1 polymer-forming cytoskeletal protein [Paenibacillus anaericanus]